METLIAYIFKVNIALAVFYLLYVLMLKKDTFLMLRRWYFLSAIVFSCFYPFFTISALGDILPVREKTVQEVQTMVFIEEPILTGIVMEEDLIEPSVTIPWEQILYIAYIVIIALFALRLLWQLASILHIRAKSEKRNVFGVPVYHLAREITPFSFFKWIFINTTTHSDTEIKQILLHEQTHAHQWHSADIVLMELLCAMFWWNPFVWLMKRELAMNLEYLADKSVLQHGVNSQEYQYHLLKLTYQKTTVQIVNNFNVSQLKQRIMMMNKTKSPTLKLAKYLAVLPLLLLFVTINSAYAQDKKGEEIFVEAEKNPEFPGGNEAFMKFLAEGIKYPVIAQENNEQGRVLANFVVEKDGTISNIKVVQGVTAALDAEAVRLLSSMPNWKPAEQRNQPVRFRFTLPIVFRLQGGSGESISPITPISADANEKGKMLDEVVVVGYGVGRPSIPISSESNNDELFIVVEEQPQFPGGTEAMIKFINDNLQYPLIAKENGIQGRVIVNFVIEKDGSLSDIQIVRGVDPSLDLEAVRLITSMPKWIPGKQRGKEVRVRYTLPISFRLSDDNTTASGYSLPPSQQKESSQSGASKEIFVVVENQPEFPGGSGEMMKFINDNIKYPEIAHENGIQGRVICSFIVGKDGSISDVEVMRGVDPSLDKEAVRVLESMPAWKPGKQRGQPVSVRFTLPVEFRLNIEEKPKVTIGGLSVDNVMSVKVQKQMEPVFAGGNSEYMKYLSQAIKYPVLAQENGLEGIIYSSFKVDENGNVTDAKIESGEHTALNNEALRVIKQMPKWTYGNDVIVSGNVTDENSQPIMGASVIVKGTVKGTVSDSHGNFRIKLSENEHVLNISYVGFKTAEINVSNIQPKKGSVEIKLPFVFRLQGEGKNEVLSKKEFPDNAVVVVGYSSTKK